MICRKARRAIWSAPDGDQGPTLKEALQAHLEGCPSCRERAQALRHGLYTLQAERPASLHPQFADRVLGAIQDAPEREERRAPRRWLAVALVGAAAALSLIVLTVVPRGLVPRGTVARPSPISASFSPSPFSAVVLDDQHRPAACYVDLAGQQGADTL
jgi:anti-sigma factor RsiW